MFAQPGFAQSSARGRFGAGLSTHPEPAVAAGESIGSVVEMVGTAPDLAVVFVSGSMLEHFDDVLDAVRTLLAPVVLVGVSAVGVLGGSEEVEQGHAVSVWAGSLPDPLSADDVRPVRLTVADTGSGPAVLGIPSLSEADALVVIADPFRFPAEQFLDDLRSGAPNVPVIGGFASAGQAHGGNRLVLNDREFSDGAVGFIVPSQALDLTVSQGCRPVGDPWVVTKGAGNLIHELGGRPAMERLQDMVEALEPEDRARAARGLHAGFVLDERQERFFAGDFLIRSVLGADRSTGAIAVGASVEVGDLLQFQVRDADSASLELARLLPDQEAAGALVFTCNGRGTHLFGDAHHDATLIDEATAGGVAGMFCAGELGPVGGINALHGFTATIAWFRSELAEPPDA